MSCEDRLVYWKRRARDAEWRIQAIEREMEHNREWARDAFAEQRRLAERCTFLYGEAMQRGASREDLSQEVTPS